MIAAVAWVPRGAAQATPTALEPPSTEEIEELLRARGIEDVDDEDAQSLDNADSENEEEMEVDDARAQALAAAQSLRETKDVADELGELNMEDYDNEDEDVRLFGNGGLGSAFYRDGEADPYITNKDDDEDDEEEAEDMTIKASDLLILTARNEDDVSHLEVWVYEEGDEPNMYVHHDIMIPEFPLCLAWMDCNIKGGDKGNFVAVGSMRPDIEIWDLDVLDEVTPAAVLGGALPDTSDKKKKSKKKKKVQFKEGSHEDAVLTLAWNTEYRNVLASGSADHTVKVWNVASQKCERTLSCHSNKVQAVAWNPSNWTSLLSGSYDRTVTLTDMKASSSEGLRCTVDADVEALAWNPHDSNCFVVSLENGIVQGFDIRTMNSTFKIQAHQKPASAVSFNSVAPNLLATASTDKTVTLWDISEKPSCITSMKPEVGGIFSAVFCKDSPFLLAVGGSKGNLHVWNILEDPQVARKYAKYSRH